MEQEDMIYGAYVEVVSLSDTKDWGVDEQYITYRHVGAVCKIIRKSRHDSGSLWYVIDESNNIAVYSEEELIVPRVKLEQKYKALRDAHQELRRQLKKSNEKLFLFISVVNKLDELVRGPWPWVPKNTIQNICKILKEIQKLP
jgi:hypothetical protein